MGRRHCVAVSVTLLTVVAVLTYSVQWSQLPKPLAWVGLAEDLSCATSAPRHSVLAEASLKETSSQESGLGKIMTDVDTSSCKIKISAQNKSHAKDIHPLILESKNPCWWQNSTVNNSQQAKLICLPYFVLAGVSKCGSTDIFNRLNQHPQVLSPSRKEPSWFDWRRFSPDLYPFDWYISTFQTAVSAIAQDIKQFGSSKRIVGDGSPTYFWRNLHWKQLPENHGCTEPQVVNPHTIHHLLPHAKIIFSFRNPVNIIYSKYLSMADKGFLQSPELFHSLVVKEIKHYKDCFTHSSVRSCAYNITLSSQAEVRLEKGLYAIFLADWFRVFPKDHIHVIRFEDYITDIRSHLQKMFQFLQLDAVSDSQMQEIVGLPPSNPGLYYNIGPMLPKTRELLENFYSAFNHQLSDMLLNKAFLWLS